MRINIVEPDTRPVFSDVDQDIADSPLNFIAIDQMLVGYRQQDTECRKKNINKVIWQMRRYVFTISLTRNFKATAASPPKKPTKTLQ
jgi:hypothetical protein